MDNSNKKQVIVLFLCDKRDKDCAPDANPLCGTECEHTTKLSHAKNKYEFKNGAIPFLSNCACVCTDERCIFIEEA